MSGCASKSVTESVPGDLHPLLQNSIFANVYGSLRECPGQVFGHPKSQRTHLLEGPTL